MYQTQILLMHWDPPLRLQVSNLYLSFNDISKITS